jgi:RNA-binding protein
MSLNAQQARYLRAQAHHLKPVVMVGGKGISEGLLNELDVSLTTHELLKVSIAADKENRKLAAQELCRASGAELVQLIGNIAILYRPAPQPRIVLPAA